MHARSREALPKPHASDDFLPAMSCWPTPFRPTPTGKPVAVVGPGVLRPVRSLEWSFEICPDPAGPKAYVWVAECGSRYQPVLC